MRNSRHFFTMLALVLSARAPAAEEIGSRHITMNVSLAARTSLKVSSRVLQFDVTRPDEAATAALEFAAGARMPAGCDVVLTIEPLQAVVDGTVAAAVTDLRFVGEGTGMLSGSIAADRSTIVARWQGSGLREGRLLFTLRARAAGSYSLPVRLVLSTP
jgi:hypothetical protein